MYKEINVGLVFVCFILTVLGIVGFLFSPFLIIISIVATIIAGIEISK